MGDFHNKVFDDATKLKLEIFRGYIREWLPVFLSKKSFPEIHIYDFFCGPGRSGAGENGSPLVVLEEVKRYLEDPARPVDPSIQLHLHFNDVKHEKVERLREIISGIERPQCCSVTFSALDFSVAFEQAQSSLLSKYTANLLIIDQCGLKAVSDRIFREVVRCPATDMLFFISSNHIRRFIKTNPIQRYLPLLPEEIAKVPPKEVHRFICNEGYRKLIPKDCDYFVSPFSIEKQRGGHIHGLIFGSSSLFGLEKFLQVCWESDEISGEANYNIDNDPVDVISGGQMSFIPDHEIPKKKDKFRQDLLNLLRAEEIDNRTLYRFTLENGFLAKHATGVLRVLQDEGRLEVYDLASDEPARKGSFYLTWKQFKLPARAQFRMIGN